MNMKIKRYLPFLGIAIFLYILLKLNVSNIVKEINNADIKFLLIALVFVFISMNTSALKWFVIARKQKTTIGFIDAFKINLMSVFYGFITPAKIGNIIRADFLRKFNNDRLGKGLSNYVLDKTLDLSSLVFLTGVFSFMFKNIVPVSFFYFSFPFFIIIIIMLFIFGNEKISRKIFEGIYKLIVSDKKTERRFNEGFSSFYKDMPERKFFILFFILNIIHWLVVYTIHFFIGNAVGINVSFFYFLVFMPIATMAGQIPITIAGLGTREAVMISLFGLLGVSATKVFSMSMIDLFMGGIIPVTIGIFLILKNKKMHEKGQHYNPGP